MFINKLRLNNFRCFKESFFSFDKNIIIIEGKNGSGKSSLLEALYYIAYLKSFRTRLSKELISFEQNFFFIQAMCVDNIDSDIENTIQVGYSKEDGKTVKFNQKQIQSYKQIIDFYQVVCATVDDLQLIGGSPEIRRAYLNQSLCLADSDAINLFRQYKQILNQRNSFLIKYSQIDLSANLKQELYTWTKALWEKTKQLHALRVNLLINIENIVNQLIKEHFFNLEQINIKFKYISKNFSSEQSFDQFWDFYEKNLLKKEQLWSRSLFGVHLDDFFIFFKAKNAKIYASRGQQKLILFLLKIAQLKNKKINGCLLLDDFLTDFDNLRLKAAFELLLKLDCQVFLTTPSHDFVSNSFINTLETQILSL